MRPPEGRHRSLPTARAKEATQPSLTGAGTQQPLPSSWLVLWFKGRPNSLSSQQLQSYQQPHRPQIVNPIDSKEWLWWGSNAQHLCGTQQVLRGLCTQNWPHANHSLHSRYSQLHSGFGSVSIIPLEDRSAPQDVTWFCEEWLVTIIN
jgi:hypothetical protein